MSNESADQIAASSLKAQSVTNDGVTVSRRTMADEIAGRKFADANNALDQLVAGTHDFYRVRMNFPGAGGSNATDC